MTIIRGLRDIELPFQHVAGPASNATVAALPAKGLPGNPKVYTGGGSEVTFEITVELPVTASDSSGNFAGTEPGKSFLFEGVGWVELFRWVGSPLIIRDVYILSTEDAGLSSPVTVLDMDFHVKGFLSDRSDEAPYCWRSIISAQLNPSAGSDYIAARLEPSAQKAQILTASNYNVLALHNYNNHASASSSGQILVVVSGVVCG